MSDLPAKPLSFWARIFSPITKAFAKPVEKPERPAHGADWSRSQGAPNPYPAKLSMAAFASHGYVYAAVSRASQDLAALPIKLIRGKGDKSEIVDDHPFLDLMDQPSTYKDGFSFREQLIVDLMLSGGCYVLLAGSTDIPTSLFRLHPEQTKIITDPVMGIKGFEFEDSGAVVEYGIDRVVYAQSASWAAGVNSLYGVGGVQPLQREISADISAQKLASDSAKKGRPDILISPADEADIWDYEQRRAILDAYRGMSSEGGAMVLSGQVKIDPLQITPRDLEFQSVRDYTRQAISAVFGVPPSVLGDNSANFAVSRQQAQNYWEVQTKRGKRLSFLLTQIAKRFDKDLRVEVDYSGVEALQDIRNAQLDRITKHILNGMDAGDAYQYEGMEDSPLVAADKRESPAEDVGDEEGQNVRAMEMILRAVSSGDQKKTLDKQARDRVWRSWVEKAQGPAERAIQRAVYDYLRGARKRYMVRADRYILVNGSKDPTPIDWGELLGVAEETRILQSQLGRQWIGVWALSGNDALKDVYKSAGRTLPLDLTFGSREAAVEAVDFTSMNIAQSTATKIKEVIEKGLLEGDSVDDIAKSIEEDTSFNIKRSRTIARTESTKAINLASVQAYNTAMADGIKIRKEWLSARDDLVRETHQELDGQIVGVNELFTVPSTGDQSMSPSAFGVPSEDINCRCTVLPVVEG